MTDSPEAHGTPLSEEALLARFFPSLAVQRRTALSNLYLAVDTLIPADARDFDPGLDRNLAVLDLNYYRLLRLAENLSAAAELGTPLPPPEEDRAEYRILQARLASASGRYAEAMTALRQAERTGPLPKLLERELLQAMELAARELQDYKTAYECAARQLKL